MPAPRITRGVARRRPSAESMYAPGWQVSRARWSEPHPTRSGAGARVGFRWGGVCVPLVRAGDLHDAMDLAGLLTEIGGIELPVREGSAQGLLHGQPIVPVDRLGDWAAEHEIG